MEKFTIAPIEKDRNKIAWKKFKEKYKFQQEKMKIFLINKIIFLLYSYIQ